MKKMIAVASTLSLALLAAVPASAAEILTEGFDNVSALPSRGWVLTNRSAPEGLVDGWFQGSIPDFEAQSGTGYAASNFNEAAEGGTIANWLISPIFSTEQAGIVNLWIRGAGEGFSDMIALGFSSGSANTADFSMGGPRVFDDHLWTRISVSYAAGGAGSVGRFAIEHVGPADSANFVGVDNLSIDTVAPVAAAVPEPATWAMTIVGMGAIGSTLRRRRKVTTRLSYAA